MARRLEAEEVVATVIGASNHFEALLLPAEATSSGSIRSQYLRLALAVHPDKCDLPEAVEAFKRLLAAFNELYDPQSQAAHLESLTQEAKRREGVANRPDVCKRSTARPVPASKFGGGIWGAGFGIRLGAWNVVGTDRCTPKDVTDAVGTAVQLEHMRLVVSLARGASMKAHVPTDCWTRSAGMDGPGAPTLIELPLDVYDDPALVEGILQTSSERAPLVQFWRGKEMVEVAVGDKEKGNKCLHILISHVASAVGATGAPNGIRVLRDFLAGRISASGRLGFRE